MKKLIYFTVAIILLSCNCVFAHRGRTDADGGHYERSTGEYHYHHGYSAHQHPNGVCPYDISQSKVSSSSASQPISIIEPTLIPTPTPISTPKPTVTIAAKTIKPTVLPKNIKNKRLHNVSSFQRFFWCGSILVIIYILYRFIKKTR